MTAVGRPAFRLVILTLLPMGGPTSVTLAQAGGHAVAQTDGCCLWVHRCLCARVLAAGMTAVGRPAFRLVILTLLPSSLSERKPPRQNTVCSVILRPRRGRRISLVGCQMRSNDEILRRSGGFAASAPQNDSPLRQAASCQRSASGLSVSMMRPQSVGRHRAPIPGGRLPPDTPRPRCEPHPARH